LVKQATLHRIFHASPAWINATMNNHPPIVGATTSTAESNESAIIKKVADQRVRSPRIPPAL
jgi:hypothetical protein